MLWLFVCSMFLQVSPQVPPRDGAPADGPATGIIRGLVTDKDTGIPLVRVQVRLAPRRVGDTPIRAETDAQGRYELRGVPAGSHTVAAVPVSYRVTHLAQIYGASGPMAAFPADMGSKLELADGQVRDGIDFALMRALAIEGRVVDEFGDPMAHVRVQANVVGERRVGTPGGVRETDDRGAFRIFGLPPGSYRLCAEPRELSSIGVGGSPPEIPTRACYPEDTTDSPVTVAASDAEGIEIRLRRSRTFTISGIVLDAEGAPVEDAHVSLVVETPGMTSSVQLDAVAGGRFTRRGLPPGDYEINARVGINSDNPLDKRDVQMGYTRFRVEAADVTGLVVTLSKGARISGRIVPEDAPLPPGTKLVVHAVLDRSLTRNVSMSLGMAAPAADLSFEIPSVFGPAQVIVQGLPRGWMVKTVRAGSRDITGREAEFPAGRVSTVEIVLSSRGSVIAGTATDDSGKPMTGSTSVVLIPVDEELAWRPEYSPGGSVRENGSFEIQGLRAGEYWIAAFDWAVLATNYNRPDPSLRPRIAKVAERVVLGEGEKRTIELRLAKLPDAR